MPDRLAAGLCDRCVYQRRIESAKGSTFSLCQRALKDPVAFSKYPRLPVRECPGFVTVRPAVADDVPAIQAIYAHWVLTGVASFEIDPPGVEEIRRRFDEIAARGLPYTVAMAANSEIAGYAYAALYRPRLAYRFTVEDSIYLHPNFAGQGIGKVLLDSLIDKTSRQGYKQMIAVIGGGMENAASVALHARCGFEHAGILKAVGFKFERWLDTVLMQRPLVSGS
jgi:L-amino acid N-acyltransferase YncA